jgi:pimeloyl-ACP methyl ester carboxylesterase
MNGDQANRETGVMESFSEPAAASSCPPPLRCREVWQTVQRDAQTWLLPRDGYALRGWTFGAGPPLYFVNGFAGAAAIYSLLAYLLREQFRCVLFDIDLSAARLNTVPLNTAGDFAADLLAVADWHGDAAVTVFGATFGGTVALQAALSAPGRIERLILQNVPAHGSLTWAERTVAWWCAGSRRAVAQFPGRLRVQTFNHRRWFPPLDPDRWAFFLEATGAQPVALPARQALALERVDLRPQLTALRQPVLLIDTEGAGPRLAAAQQDVLQRLPQAREERLHTTGLLAALTHPHRLAKLMPMPCTATV